jgi:hypothetical protein
MPPPSLKLNQNEGSGAELSFTGEALVTPVMQRSARKKRMHFLGLLNSDMAFIPRINCVLGLVQKERCYGQLFFGFDIFI